MLPCLDGNGRHPVRLPLDSELGAVDRWAVGIGGGGVAWGRMVGMGIVSYKPADALFLQKFLWSVANKFTAVVWKDDVITWTDPLLAVNIM